MDTLRRVKKRRDSLRNVTAIGGFALTDHAKKRFAERLKPSGISRRDLEFVLRYARRTRPTGKHHGDKGFPTHIRDHVFDIRKVPYRQRRQYQRLTGITLRIDEVSMTCLTMFRIGDYVSEPRPSRCRPRSNRWARLRYERRFQLPAPESFADLT